MCFFGTQDENLNGYILGTFTDEASVIMQHVESLVSLPLIPERDFE